MTAPWLHISRWQMSPTLSTKLLNCVLQYGARYRDNYRLLLLLPFLFLGAWNLCTHFQGVYSVPIFTFQRHNNIFHSLSIVLLPLPFLSLTSHSGTPSWSPFIWAGSSDHQRWSWNTTTWMDQEVWIYRSCRWALRYRKIDFHETGSSSQDPSQWLGRLSTSTFRITMSNCMLCWFVTQAWIHEEYSGTHCWVGPFDRYWKRT